MLAIQFNHKHRNRLGIIYATFFLLAYILCGCKNTDTPTSENASFQLDDSALFETQTDTTSTEADTTTTNITADADLSYDLDYLLDIAFMPVGNTMYIWGGGWNEEDTGAGIEALSKGVSPRWAEFAAKQDAQYDYNNYRYQIHDGLDCSGYIGWITYNLFPNGDTGYVVKSTDMSITLSDYGFGTYSPVSCVVDWMPGDIMSMQGHVWMVLKELSDGSVLLVHASPPGVRVCGTAAPGVTQDQLANNDRTLTKAEQLATKIMSSAYPDWYSRYPVCSVQSNYLTLSSQFRWNTDTLSDTLGLMTMSDEEFEEYIIKKAVGY